LPRALPADPSATRQSIVESAHALVHQYGPRLITVEDVAKAAGVSRPTVYAHFGDKKGLLTAVWLWNGHLVRVELERKFRRAETFADKVAAAAVFGVSNEAPMWLRHSEPESLVITLTTSGAPWLERAARFWEPLVIAAQEAGEIRAELDPRRAALWVARSLFAVALMSPQTPSRAELAKIRDDARTFIAGGIGPAAGGAAAGRSSRGRPGSPRSAGHT
jgi:AcrR family transcriptional regulator